MKYKYSVVRLPTTTKDKFKERATRLSKLFGKKIPMTKMLDYLASQENIYPDDFSRYIKGKRRK